MPNFQKPVAPQLQEITPGPIGGLPLTGSFEAGRRGLEDTLSSRLADINAQRGQVKPMTDLSLARLGTFEGQDIDTSSADLGARGIFGPGVGNQVLQDVRAGYDRQRQDLALEVSQMLADLARAESEAQLGYTSGLADLNIDLANQQAVRPMLQAPSRRGRVRRRGGRRG